MTTIEAARYVKENGCCQMRPRKDTPGAWDVRPGMAGQAKFNRLPLMKLINLGWSVTKAA